ncbi:MAG: type II toxin-antitoxin system prevent-host-death family antitoxin [Bifidobacteriaceae bacterium]|jgi:prevent-host-death family protein|nr:type II toxin-antitoxin system prevent-host-death family antitoxin [Bifidobacteriaceae bacterium]
MAATIGAYEAKTHFAQLLDRVEAGESITITRHGRPVAHLAPGEGAGAVPRQAALAELAAVKRWREGSSLGDLTIRAAIDEGRGR